MSSPRKFRVWDGERMFFPREEGLLSLVFENGGWKLIRSRESIAAELICYSSDSDSSLMLYTGLTDSEGTEMYEGDVVDIVFQGDGDSRGVVTWGNEKGRWQIEYGGYESYTNPLAAPARNWQPRVIGNRYENPELLKEPS